MFVSLRVFSYANAGIWKVNTILLLKCQFTVTPLRISDYGTATTWASCLGILRSTTLHQHAPITTQCTSRLSVSSKIVSVES